MFSQMWYYMMRWEKTSVHTLNQLFAKILAEEAVILVTQGLLKYFAKFTKTPGPIRRPWLFIRPRENLKCNYQIITTRRPERNTLNQLPALVDNCRIHLRLLLFDICHEVWQIGR